MRKTIETIESGEIHDVLSDLINVQKTLRHLTFMLNENADGWPIDAIDGLHVLQGHQIELLEEIKTAVECKDLMLDEFRAKDRDAAGNEAAASPRAVSLREEFIASKAQAGEKPGDIAAAMNMKRTSIERVIRQLRGDGGRATGAQAAVA